MVLGSGVCQVLAMCSIVHILDKDFFAEIGWFEYKAWASQDRQIPKSNLGEQAVLFLGSGLMRQFWCSAVSCTIVQVEDGVHSSFACYIEFLICQQ